MSSHDARVKEIEVLYHFASSIASAGVGLAASAARLVGAAEEERGQFRSLFNTIEHNYAAAQQEYADALSEWEEEQDPYSRQALDAAEERLRRAQENYEEGLTICQQVEQLVIEVISRSQRFGQSVMSRTDLARDNVKLAAAHLQDYLNR